MAGLHLGHRLPLPFLSLSFILFLSLVFLFIFYFFLTNPAANNSYQVLFRA